jgi:predicted nucleic acid-binding protein
MAAKEAVIALDTNLLIYAHRENTPEHPKARKAILEALNHADGWGICLPTIAEFWSIVTRSGHPGGASSATTVNHFFHYLLTEGHGHVWTPGPGFGERLMRWAAALKVRGLRIFDLQIALIAFEHGAREIWTHDHSFISVPAVKVRDPFDLV